MCEEDIITIDFTELDDKGVDYLIYSISEIYEELIKENYITIRIIKSQYGHM